MSERILVNTADLTAWASQLEAVSESLADAARALSRIDTSEEWWRRVDYERSFRLRDEESRQSMSNFRNAVSEWSGALRRYDTRVQKLAGSVRKASTSFERAENGVSSAISDLLGGRGDAGTGATHAGGKTDGKQEADWKDKLKGFIDKKIDQLVGPAKWIGDKIADAAAFWYNDYKQKGTTYKVIQTLLASGKIVVATVATLAAWCGTGLITIGTLGTGSVVSVPMATLISMYSVNTIANSITDITNCWNGNVDQVGEVNYLKDICKTSYGFIGEKLGNREAGEKFGEGLYAVGEITTLISNVTNAFKDVQSAVNKAGSVKNYVSQIMDGADDFWHLISKVDVKELSYQSKLFKYANPAFQSSIDNIKSVIKDSFDIGKNIFSLF